MIARSRAQRWLLLLMCLVIPWSYLGLEKLDGRWFLVLNGRPVDVTGQADQAWTRWWRDCGQVQVMHEPAALRLALDAVRRFSPPDSLSGEWVSVQQHKSWVLAQVRFERLHDAVVLMRTSARRAEVVAVWSGFTHPHQPEAWIRRHLIVQAPQAPPALLDCFAFQAKSGQ